MRTHLFKWQFARFLIFNYYLIEAVIASSFYEAYLYTETTLLPMNIIFFIFMAVDIGFKVLLTPKM